MTRVYVAASSREYERARRAMRMLEARGGKVAIDWTLPVEQLAQHRCSTADMSDGYAREAAEKNLLALRDSKALLFLAPQTISRDSWVELGFALALGIPVAVGGDAARHSISTRLVPRFETDEEAIDWLLDAERRRAEVTRHDS
jgi:nucleoside 2-deoxyribosyltransferase